MLTYFENGLSWAVVFNKREALCQAFADFDPAAVATMTDRDVDLLMKDHTIIRNRAKIEATVHNARLLTSMSLNDIAWQYRPRSSASTAAMERRQVTKPGVTSARYCPAARGFRFVGPVVAHSFMQTVGIENGHFDGCFRAPRPAEFADGPDAGTTRCRTMARSAVRSVACTTQNSLPSGSVRTTTIPLGHSWRCPVSRLPSSTTRRAAASTSSTATSRWMRTLPAFGSGTG